jgi:hypothetical protein
VSDSKIQKETSFTHSHIQSFKSIRTERDVIHKNNGTPLYSYIISTLKTLIFVDGVRRGISFIQTNHTLNPCANVKRIQNS